MYAKRNLVTFPESVFLDLLLAEKNAIGTVQVLDDTAVLVTDKLCVVTTDEFALDIDLVIGRAPDDHAAEREIKHIDEFIVGSNLDARYI